jgi:hypothetical protein
MPTNLERVINDFASLKRDFADLIDRVKSGAVNGAGDASDALRSCVGLLDDKTRSVHGALAAQRNRLSRLSGARSHGRSGGG